MGDLALERGDLGLWDDHILQGSRDSQGCRTNSVMSPGDEEELHLLTGSERWWTMAKTLTLHQEPCAALQMSNQRRVLALLAVVHALDHQSVVLLIGQHGVGLTGLQLCVVKHPANWDVVLRDAHLKHGRSPQQGRHVFGLLQDLDGCEEAEQSCEGSGPSCVSILNFL